MKTILYKYHGAGNDFLMVDGRSDQKMAADLKRPERIVELCDRHRGFGADGLIVLENSGDSDFCMEYFNSDGSGGMMCGNGARCTVAFADFLGIPASVGDIYHFTAADGKHFGEVAGRNGNEETIRVKMIDVDGISSYEDGLFLNTGTRHLVSFVPSIDSVNVDAEGSRIRWKDEFSPVGTNVNFVESVASCHILRIRTFEKGVEAETQACGTGIVASALAAWHDGIEPASKRMDEDGRERVHYEIRTLRDSLAVDFTVNPDAKDSFRNILLTGPAFRVGEIRI